MASSCVRTRHAAAAFLVFTACGSSPAAPSVDGPGTWTSSTSLPEARFEADAIVSRGRMFYLGGISGTGDLAANAFTSDHVDVYDPATLSWSSGPPLPADAARHHLAVAAIGDTVYLLGGFVGILGANPTMTPNGHAYRFDGASWTRLADAPTPRGGSTAQAIGGVIYVAGGGNDDRVSSAALYAYDPSTDKWTERAPMRAARQHLASCVVDGKMLVVGGWGETKNVVATAELYDPVADRWSAIADMPTARGGLGATTLGTRCFVVGGESWSASLPATFTDNQAFDPATGAWTSYKRMPTARHGLGVVAFGDAIYTVGGGPVQGNSYTNVVEVFRP